MKSLITNKYTQILFFLFILLSTFAFVNSLSTKQVYAQSECTCGYYTCQIIQAGVCITGNNNCTNGGTINNSICPANTASCNSAYGCCTCPGGGGGGSSPFGNVAPPTPYGDLVSQSGLSKFIGNIVKYMIVIAGLYALFNLILAGYSFMSAGGDPQKIAGSWAKIWQTLLGLTVAVGAFVLAAIFGKLLFNDYNYLLQLKIFGP